MSQHNPWLSATQEAPHDGVTPPSPGPATPQGGVDEVDTVDRLPRRTPTTRALAWWLGAHGGAGESTLAELLPQTQAADHRWPSAAVGAVPEPVVLVCRSHARGLLAAQRALTDWASGAVPGVELLGLVVVADAPGRLPKPLRDLARLVGGGAPRRWHLPWVEELRFAPVDDESAAPPAPARRVLRAVHHAAQNSAAASAAAAIPTEEGPR